MHKTEYSILKIFRENPNKEFSTKDIVKGIFPKEYMDEEQIYHDFKDKQEISRIKNSNAKLHRNVLYHLNKLIEDEILSISKQGNKGEKFFKLNINEGEEIIFQKKHKRILISKPFSHATPIEGYEQDKIIFKFEPDTWITRINSVLIQSEESNNDDLMSLVHDSFSSINDALCLNDFERYVQYNSRSTIEELLYQLKIDSEDYGKHVTLIIDYKNVTDPRRIIEFLEDYMKLKASNMKIIFDLQKDDLKKHKEVWEEIVKIFISTKTELFIKNKDIKKSPYFIGRAGPYTFQDEEWEKYASRDLNKYKGIVCSFGSIAIDIKKFFDKKSDMNEFRKLINNILKHLFTSSSQQRSRSREYFNSLLKINRKDPMKFFESGRYYIRFWNYGWKQPDLDQELMLNLIKSTKKKVHEFCNTQKSIYNACGMPTQFDAAFSCAFNSFTGDGFSKLDFKRTQLGNIDELFKGETKDNLKTKEKISEIFDGGDIAKIHRRGPVEAEEILNEIEIVMTNFKIPFFCYNFGHIQGADMKLTSFFEHH